MPGEGLGIFYGLEQHCCQNGLMINLIGILIYANSNGISGMRRLYVNNEAGHAGCVQTEHLIDLHSSKATGSRGQQVKKPIYELL